MPKVSFPQYRHWLRACPTLLKTSHHLVTLISNIIITSAKFCPAASGAPGGTVGPSTTMNTMSLPAEYFESLLSPVVDWVCTQGPWQGWRERQTLHNLHLSSFMQEMAPFIWVSTPCRLITLPTVGRVTVGSGIWLPGEKSDTFLIALEVQREYRA